MGFYAAMLMACPVLAVPPVDYQATPEEWARLKAWAMAVEIVAPGVEVWRDVSPWRITDGYGADMRWCRCAWEKVRDCPRLEAANNLPPHGLCVLEYDRLTGSIGRHEDERLVRLYLSEQIYAVIEQEKKDLNYWRLAMVATNRRANAVDRRIALRELAWMLP